jgi:hypothetical protein
MEGAISEIHSARPLKGRVEKLLLVKLHRRQASAPQRRARHAKQVDQY